jgi:hypothetical protein
MNGTQNIEIDPQLSQASIGGAGGAGSLNNSAPPGEKRDLSDDTNSNGDLRGNSQDPTTGGAADGNKKRRVNNSASSRGVANLTPDQLAKKRANDREAQRAIRERTKNQIENLERKIRELTSQQPYQELQHVLRQKELVEAENADIKKRLANVLALIQPVLGLNGEFGPIDLQE